MGMLDSRLNETVAGITLAGGSATAVQADATARFGMPVEISQMACFLPSDRASYVNGQAIAVDGGLSASHPWVFPRQK